MNNRLHSVRLALLTAACLNLSGTAAAAPKTAATQITGCGPSLAAPLFQKWSEAYLKGHDVKVGYEVQDQLRPADSLAYRKWMFLITAEPLDPVASGRLGVVQMPLLLAGVTPVVHIGGGVVDTLQLTIRTVGDILRGRYSNWRDPALVALNPGHRIPGLSITLVHQPDGWLSTRALVQGLARQSPDWLPFIHVGPPVPWGRGVAVANDAAAAAELLESDGAFGFLPLNFTGGELIPVAIGEMGAERATPSIASFTAAVIQMEWQDPQLMSAVVSLEDEAAPWPFTIPLYVAVRRDQPDRDQARQVVEFLEWCLDLGGETAAEEGMAPLPPEMAVAVKSIWMRELRLMTNER